MLTPIKSVPPNAQHLAFRKDLHDVIRKHGPQLDAMDLLAALSHLVGQVIALQDQRLYTPQAAMDIVSANIVQGNSEVVENLLGAAGGHA